MKHSIIPEHRSDKVKKIDLKFCERCGMDMRGWSRKKFCGSCSDIRAEERRRAKYLNRKAANKKSLGGGL